MQCGVARWLANCFKCYQDAQLSCFTMRLRSQRTCAQTVHERHGPQMLGSAPQPSLIPRVLAGMGTGGGCGGDLAPSPGMLTDELALTLEMKPTLQLQCFSPDVNLNAACGQLPF